MRAYVCSELSVVIVECIGTNNYIFKVCFRLNYIIMENYLK